MFLIDLSGIKPPETYISAPSGDLLYDNETGRTKLERISADRNSTTDFPEVVVDGISYSAGTAATIDTVREDKFVLNLSAQTGWWPGNESEYRFSVRIDNEPAGKFQYPA